MTLNGDLQLEQLASDDRKRIKLDNVVCFSTKPHALLVIRGHL